MKQDVQHACVQDVVTWPFAGTRKDVRMADQGWERLLAAFADHLLRNRLADEKHGETLNAQGGRNAEL